MIKYSNEYIHHMKYMNERMIKASFNWFLDYNA